MAFGSKARAKKKAEEQKMDAGTKAAIEEIKVVSPLQKAMDAKAQAMFDWENQTGPKDVTTAPGFGDMLDIYGNAEAMAAKQRIGDPSHAFAENANPNYSKQLDQLGQMERYNTRASGLAEGLQGLKNEAYGLADNSINRDMQRRSEYANAMQGYNTGYYNRPQKTPTWERIARIAVGGIGAI